MSSMSTYDPPSPSLLQPVASSSKSKRPSVKVLNTHSILDAARDGKVISPAEAVHLLQLTRDEDLLALRQAADEIRQRQVGEAVFYSNAFSLYLTNYCEFYPTLYDYPKKAGDERGFALSIDGIDEILERALAQSAQQLYVSGGGAWSSLRIAGLEAPTLLKTYAKVLSHVRERAPGLELTGFSPDEIEFLSIISNRNERYLLEMFHDLGLRGLGGNGSEILVDEVRQRISPKKCSVKRWFEIANLASQLGLSVQAKIEAGPLESLTQRVSQLERLRQALKTARDTGQALFNVLVPQMWTRIPTALSPREVLSPQIRPEDRFKLTAVMRLYLGDLLPEQQVFWTANGVHEAQDALTWGANGLGGTNALDYLSFLAGTPPLRLRNEFNQSDFKRLIEEMGRTPLLKTWL